MGAQSLALSPLCRLLIFFLFPLFKFHTNTCSSLPSEFPFSHPKCAPQARPSASQSFNFLPWWKALKLIAPSVYYMPPPSPPPPPFSSLLLPICVCVFSPTFYIREPPSVHVLRVIHRCCSRVSGNSWLLRFLIKWITYKLVWVTLWNAACCLVCSFSGQKKLVFGLMFF